MSRTIRFIAVLAALAFTSANARAAILENGNFDGYSGSPSDGTPISGLSPASWQTISSPLLKTFAGGLTAQSGTYFVGLFHPGGLDGIYQSISTSAGQLYRFEFYTARQTATGAPTLDVDVFDGTTFAGNGDLLDTSILVNSVQDTWQKQTLYFTAISSTTTIRFVENASSNTTSVDLFIDTASVAIPEPSTFALAGLGLVAWVGRRRRRK